MLTVQPIEVKLHKEMSLTAEINNPKLLPTGCEFESSFLWEGTSGQYGQYGHLWKPVPWRSLIYG